jgi:hypothetical protein
MQEYRRQLLTYLNGPTRYFCLHLQMGLLNISVLQSAMGPHGLLRDMRSICTWALPATPFYTYNMGSLAVAEIIIKLVVRETVFACEVVSSCAYQCK